MKSLGHFFKEIQITEELLARKIFRGGSTLELQLAKRQILKFVFFEPCIRLLARI